MALLDAESEPSDLTWTSTLYANGLADYNRPKGVLNEEFDFDFRDPDVDDQRGLAAGYMMLGHWGLVWPAYFQYIGDIHALELHTVALSDTAVLDVIGNLRSRIDPSVPPQLKCEPCVSGTFDGDADPSTTCSMCDSGRFSDVIGASVCSGTCEIGSTILQEGAISASVCTLCPSGSFGSRSALLDDTTTICVPCKRGRISATIGSDSNETCSMCPSGQFSGSGWQMCEPSGCSDALADNYVPHATIDDGSCIYNCPDLWNQTRGGNQNGGCVIYGSGEWRQFAANGTSVGDGPVGHFLEGHWIVQGRPLAGSTPDAPEYASYTDAITTDVASTVTLRYLL
jgi:hypothetical protein